jgi:ubiquinol-cytochrome c reductase cytochrome b subunit
LDGIPSHPYHTTHGLWGTSIFLLCFCAVVFFAPEAGGYFLEHANFIPADSLKTPPHIAPVWYFTPFYSMLRATTDSMVNLLCAIIGIAAAFALVKGRMGHLAKALLLVAAAIAVFLLKTLDARFWGVVVMGSSVFILFFLPWLDHAPVKSMRYRPAWHKYVYGVFIASFFALGYFGSRAPSALGNYASQAGTIVYFGFFLTMPWWSRLGRSKAVPERVVYTH